MSRSLGSCFALALLALFPGCIAVSLGTDASPPTFESHGWGSAYAAVTHVPDYDGTILGATLFRGGENTGELASIEIWPLGEFGVGLLGLRARLFNGEVGAGTLFYQPRLRSPAKAEASTP